MRLIATTLATCLATTAAADLAVTFRDGAPKDRFTITNTASCATGPLAVTIDLVGSPFNLIFDITGDGAGVEVFQPFELVAGADVVTGVTEVSDGDTQMTLMLAPMEMGGEVAFTIDLDDTVGSREITVNGSEIAGAMVRVSSDDALAEGMFDDTGTAQVILPTCLS